MKSIGDRVDRWVPESALLNHLIRKEHHLPKHPKTIRFGVHEHPEKKILPNQANHGVWLASVP